jgi:hypothetical protein
MNQMKVAADALKKWLTDDGLTMADLEAAMVAAKARDGQSLLATIKRARKGDTHKLLARAREGGPRVCGCSLGEKLYEDPDFAAAFPPTSEVGMRLRLVVDKAPSMHRNLDCWRSHREAKGCGKGRKYAPIQIFAKRFFLPETYALVRDLRSTKPKSPIPESGGSARQNKAVQAEEVVVVPQFCEHIPDDEDEKVPFAHYISDDEPDVGLKRKLSSSEPSEQQQQQPAKKPRLDPDATAVAPERLVTAATVPVSAPVNDPMEVDQTPQLYFEKKIYAPQVRIDSIAETFFPPDEQGESENKLIESYGLFDAKQHTELVSVDLMEGTRLFEHLAGLQELLARTLVTNMGVLPNDIGDEAARIDTREKGDANRALHQLLTLAGEGHVASLHLTPPFMVRDNATAVSIKPDPKTTLVIHVTGEVCIRFQICTLPSEEVFNSAKVDFWTHSTRCVYDKKGAWFSLGTGLHLLHVAPQTEVDPRVEILLAAADYASVYIASFAPVKHRLADMVDSENLVLRRNAAENAKYSARGLTPKPLSPPASPRPAPATPDLHGDRDAMNKKLADDAAKTAEHNRLHVAMAALDCVFPDPNDDLSFQLSTPALTFSMFFSGGLMIINGAAFLIDLKLSRDKLARRTSDGTIRLKKKAVKPFADDQLTKDFLASLRAYRKAEEEDIFLAYRNFDELRRAGEEAGYGHVLVDNVYRATPASSPSPLVASGEHSSRKFRFNINGRKEPNLSGSVPPPPDVQDTLMGPNQ